MPWLSTLSLVDWWVAVNAVGCHMKMDEISCGCQQEPGLTCIEAGEPWGNWYIQLRDTLQRCRFSFQGMWDPWMAGSLTWDASTGTICNAHCTFKDCLPHSIGTICNAQTICPSNYALWSFLLVLYFWFLHSHWLQITVVSVHKMSSLSSTCLFKTLISRPPTGIMTNKFWS